MSEDLFHALDRCWKLSDYLVVKSQIWVCTQLRLQGRSDTQLRRWKPNLAASAMNSSSDLLYPRSSFACGLSSVTMYLPRSMSSDALYVFAHMVHILDADC